MSSLLSLHAQCSGVHPHPLANGYISPLGEKEEDVTRFTTNQICHYGKTKRVGSRLQRYKNFEGKVKAEVVSSNAGKINSQSLGTTYMKTPVK